MNARPSRSTAHDVPPDPNNLPALLTVPETARLLRIGVNAAYAAVRTGQIPHVRFGTTIRIPKDALLRQADDSTSSR